MKFLYNRPFGVEIEVNSFDGSKFTPKEKLPQGIHYVANLISKLFNEYVEVRDFGHTHWRETYGCWIVKPDNSCGIEVCSPIVKGWIGLKKVCQVVDLFQNDKLININSNCALHIHIDVSDLNLMQITNILKWWIKFEPVFFDSVPDIRKNNKFCQFIGLRDDLIDEEISNIKLIELLGKDKYGSVNSFHFYNKQRLTLEFRLGENTLCHNSFFLKNWVRLIVHFLETTKDIPIKSLVWLDLKDLFDMLGFLDDDLSSGMTQIRDWFLGRIYYNLTTDINDFFNNCRDVTKKQVDELLNLFKYFNLRQSLYPNKYGQAVYDKIYSV